MLEMMGTPAPAPARNAPPTANGLDGRVEAGLDFAQMLRQAEKEQSPLPKAEQKVDAPPKREGAGAETGLADSEARDKAVEAGAEDEIVEEIPTEQEQAAAVVAVAVEVEIAPDFDEGEFDEEGEGEIDIAPVYLAETENDEEAPLEADVEAETGEEAMAPAAAPIVEVEQGNPLELLNFSELMDPDLMVEKSPEQLIARLTQAAGSTAMPGLQDELAETVMPQVIRNLAMLVREGGAEMRLQLTPADLGDIEIRVRTAEGVVRGLCRGRN